jgi:hypothetical protein
MNQIPSSCLLRTFGLTLLLGLIASCATQKETVTSTTGQAPKPQPTPAAATPSPSAAIQTAGELVVELDARDPSAGTATWVNKGSLGDFTRIGAPKLASAGGQPAVEFNGTNDAYRSERPMPATVTGAHARSIEVWVFNPSLNSTEECMVAWGHRGTSLANLAFNYGSGGEFSAVTHYDGDMGWGDESPADGQWHHLVYTYDGSTAKIYDNAVERGSQEFALVTADDTRMNIAAENSASDEPLFQSEFEPNCHSARPNRRIDCRPGQSQLHRRRGPVWSLPLIPLLNASISRCRTVGSDQKRRRA